MVPDMVIGLCKTRIAVTILAALFVAIAAVPAIAQTTAVDFRKFLTDKAGFSVEDLDVVDKGEIVVKMLPVTDKQEVAVLGIVRVNISGDLGSDAFAESLSQRKDSSFKGGGKFSSPPRAADLKDLKNEDRDFKELQKCVVGKCDLNLSAEMIKRFQSEIDWNAADHRERATDLMREMLSGYAGTYAAKGDDALGEYANRKEPVRLAENHRILLEGAQIVRQFAPEFYEYLKNYPKNKLDGVENELSWTMVDFGLNPMIALTHKAAFKRRTSGPEQIFIAAKQFFASRYVDSSLSFAVFMRMADSGAAYLIFTDRSRSDALDGLFSGMTRRVVTTEANERVTRVLGNARAKLEAGPGRSSERGSTEEVSGPVDLVLDYARDPRLQIVAVLLALAAGYLIFRSTRK